MDEKIMIQDASEVDPNLLRMLNRGLEDIEAGRTLPHKEAMEEVRRIRAERRQARDEIGVIRVLRHERNWQKMIREGISYTFD